VQQTIPTATELAAVIERLAGMEVTCTDADRIDLLSQLETLKAAAAAAQARVTVSFVASQRAEQARQGVPAQDQGRGVASQVALARRESPYRGNRHVGLAHALVHEMPATLAALQTGQISEWGAHLLVRETATLSAEHRTAVDAALAGKLAGLGDRALVAEAKKLAYKLDPASPLRRIRGAVKDRRVSLRPAPDTMTFLTGFLPVAQGVAVHTALTRHADSLRASGDERSRGQIMADTLVERVTGQATATEVPVEVQLVMTDKALLGDDDTPARLAGYGVVPASLARALVKGTTGVAERAQAWVRRLYTSPTTGELVAMDSRRRTFTGELRHFLVLRDDACRSPWCDAPIRHADHVVAYSEGGQTSEEDGQGLCEACNYAKQAPGWRARSSRSPNDPHTVVTTTPTGHSYSSRAPAPPGSPPMRDEKFPQQTERNQSVPSPSRSSDSSWCA
jgi:5-methylcytosine-specific restriction endonuclease McrA